MIYKDIVQLEDYKYAISFDGLNYKIIELEELLQRTELIRLLVHSVIKQENFFDYNLAKILRRLYNESLDITFNLTDTLDKNKITDIVLGYIPTKLHILLNTRLAKKTKLDFIKKHHLMCIGKKNEQYLKDTGCIIVDINSWNNITVISELNYYLVKKIDYTDFKYNSVEVKKDFVKLKSIFNSDRAEIIVYKYIKSIFKDAKLHYRPKWLRNELTGKNFEIDIWIPKLKLGIEYDDTGHTEAKLKDRVYNIDTKFQLIQDSDKIDTIIVLSESPKNYFYQIDKLIYHTMKSTVKSKTFEQDSLLPAIQWLYNTLGVNRVVSLDDKEWRS